MMLYLRCISKTLLLYFDVSPALRLYSSALSAAHIEHMRGNESAVVPYSLVNFSSGAGIGHVEDESVGVGEKDR
jgi:hypothetical protein